jgi:hypothetical protein
MYGNTDHDLSLNAEINCCGIDELYGIQEYTYRDNAHLERDLKAVLTEKCRVVNWNQEVSYYPPPAFMFYSCTNRLKVGNRLTSIIRKNKLGTVVKMRANKNDNSGNMLHMWTWRPNKANVKKFIGVNND